MQKSRLVKVEIYHQSMRNFPLGHFSCRSPKRRSFVVVIRPLNGADTVEGPSLWSIVWFFKSRGKDCRNRNEEVQESPVHKHHICDRRFMLNRFDDAVKVELVRERASLFDFDLHFRPHLEGGNEKISRSYSIVRRPFLNKRINLCASCLIVMKHIACDHLDAIWWPKLSFFCSRYFFGCLVTVFSPRRTTERDLIFRPAIIFVS